MVKSLMDVKVKDLSVKVIKLYLQLLTQIKQYELCKQLLKCGTAIGEFIRESRIALDENDFLQKISAAACNVERTKYWLELLHEFRYIDRNQLQEFYDSLDEISLMLKTDNKTQIFI